MIWIVYTTILFVSMATKKITVGKISRIKNQPIAQVFLKAIKGLPLRERDAVVTAIAEDKELREDLLDLAIAAEREKEPSTPIRKFYAELDARLATRCV